MGRAGPGADGAPRRQAHGMSPVGARQVMGYRCGTRRASVCRRLEPEEAEGMKITIEYCVV